MVAQCSAPSMHRCVMGACRAGNTLYWTRTIMSVEQLVLYVVVEWQNLVTNYKRERISSFKAAKNTQ